MKGRNWFWGTFLLLLAVFVIGSQTGSFGTIGVWSILGTVLLAAVIVKSLTRLNFFGIFVSMAFLYMIYQKPLSLPEISAGILLLSAVLASIGFSMLFGRRSHWSRRSDRHYHSVQTKETIGDESPYARVSFGSSSKYLHSENLKGGQFSVSFGEMDVYFDHAQLAPGGAEVILECKFGTLNLYIPKNWRVQDSLHESLGGVNNDTSAAQPDANAPLLKLSGNIHFGSVEIHYI